MESSSLAEVWRVLSESVFQDMEGWRQEHPRATLQEIEEELDARLSGLRAHMLADLAQQSEKRDWSGQVQDQHAHPLSVDAEPEEGASRLVMATDGVLIPVLPNEWAEVKMTTIGEVGQTKQGDPHCEQLSYFARLAEAETFADLASSE